MRADTKHLSTSRYHHAYSFTTTITENTARLQSSNTKIKNAIYRQITCLKTPTIHRHANFSLEFRSKNYIASYLSIR